MKSRNRYLTLILVPHHKGGQRSYHLSYSSLRWLALFALALALAVLILIVSYGKIYWRAGQYELMRQRHQMMEAEFTKLEQVKSELASLRAEEAKVRQMLGVPRQPDTLSVFEVSSLAVVRETPRPQPESNDRLVPSLMPTRGWVSSGLSRQHNGVDIAARQGRPVMAAADGVVDFVGWDNYFGNKLVLRHGDKYTTVYGHCDKILVQQMQPVRRGQVIALVGSSGKSTGPHLHYEIHVDGKVADPQGFWFSR
jgi:murein DD-endopeptidase MepM/ murein hydrolase activator NlpD